MRKRRQRLAESVFLLLPVLIVASFLLAGQLSSVNGSGAVGYLADDSSMLESDDASGTDEPGPSPSAMVDPEQAESPQKTSPAPETATNQADTSGQAPSTRPSTEHAPAKGPSASPADPPAPATPNARGQAAMQRINYPWAELLPGWTISFHDQRNGVYGYTLVPERRIEVYIRNDQSQDFIAHVIAHEIGHAVDVTLNSAEERKEWQRARGIEGAPWWPGDGASDFSTGAGDFAESFAAWQVGSSSFRSKLGPAPNAAQTKLLARLAVG